MELTCIAVDDEPLALNMVCAHIEKTPFLRLAGRYASALDALRAVQQQRVDLLFLDIEMPELNGMELARLLHSPGIKGPRVVFTTAYTQFALESYQVDALDYLLKPFLYEDFLRVARKAWAYYERSRAVPVPSAEPDTIVLKVDYQHVRVRLADILYIEGLKDYVKVLRAGDLKPLLVLTSLRALEDRLPAHQFLRLHRSYIVNLARVDAVTRNSVQVGEQQVPVSPQYKEAFARFLQDWLGS
ncbi:LytTR family DNA-binding domain-containing protein [Hymenobacter sp. BT175]|uniref:LytR/AlgR family response regulator transcription factor n=1 Tax=Hymenobacter translucens TaxID=2886507 RepID=UPI001D0E771D|nr:LytTR family DNA-binding domain-containing protein [Hymenobacter translucens]MCC2546462.1 LytTR family DNA-binding domain-containing protein [Hymenobacter translucens]